MDEALVVLKYEVLKFSSLPNKKMIEDNNPAIKIITMNIKTPSTHLPLRDLLSLYKKFL